jgi:hypothetical protein
LKMESCNQEGIQKGYVRLHFHSASSNAMGSSLDESLSSAFSSTLVIEYLNNTFFSYYVVGLVLGRSHKSLMLMYMYIRSSTRFDVN